MTGEEFVRNMQIRGCPTPSGTGCICQGHLVADRVAEVLRRPMSALAWSAPSSSDYFNDLVAETAQAVIDALQLIEFTCDGERWYSTPIEKVPDE